VVLVADPLTLNFNAVGGKDTVMLTAGYNWTATSSASWLKVSPTSGYWGNSQYITVTADENETITTAGKREAIITFKATGSGTTANDTLDIKVTQRDPTASLTYTPTQIKTFSSHGDTTAITVTSNVNWTVEIIKQEDRAWLSATPVLGSGNGRFIIAAGVNLLSTSRSGKVTLKGGGGITREITITQSRATVAPDSITLDKKMLWISYGEYREVKATIYPATVENKEVTWAVDDNSAVVMVPDGLTCRIIAGSAKKATILRVFTKEGGKTAACLVGVTPVANEPVEAAASYVSVDAGKLLVNTPVAEHITIYAASGALLLQSQKAAGPATFDISRLPAGVLIVKGESGWTDKVVVR
jgi:hypothetical protein